MEEVEQAEEVQEEATPEPVDQLITEIKDNIEAKSTDNDLDYEPEDFDVSAPVPAPTADDTVESLTARLAESERQRQHAENRSGARNLRDQVKTEYPNANPATIDKYLRLVASGQKSSDSVKSILDASNRDYSRGETASDKKWLARYEELKANVRTEVEAETKAAWGDAPKGAAVQGKGTVTYEEFQAYVKSPKATEAGIHQMHQRLKA